MLILFSPSARQTVITDKQTAPAQTPSLGAQVCESYHTLDYPEHRLSNVNTSQYTRTYQISETILDCPLTTVFPT